MPGIPTELKSIFLKHILPEIIEQQKGTHFYQCGFVFEYIGESKFTEVIKNLVDEHKFPDIWIKTHPKKKKNKTVELHLTSFSENNSVREKMNKLYKLLKDQVFKQNGKIIKENPLE